MIESGQVEQVATVVQVQRLTTAAFRQTFAASWIETLKSGSAFSTNRRDAPETEAHVIRTSRLFEAAGRHFNRGQRAFFFALGYLGWFISPWILFVTTGAVVIVTWRRQFASTAWSAMGN